MEANYIVTFLAGAIVGAIIREVWPKSAFQRAPRRTLVECHICTNQWFADCDAGDLHRLHCPSCGCEDSRQVDDGVQP